MKIFALSLSLDFRVHQPQQSYDFDPVSWAFLEEEMAQGRAWQRQFYLRLDLEPVSVRQVFLLQQDEAWRDSHCNLTFLLPDPQTLQFYLQDFSQLFKPKVAAGGLVTNEQGEYCCILHHGYWTLPKGHLDPGESAPEAALREVEEETGLTALRLGTALESTYHTFAKKKDWILKTTHWYRMQVPGSPKLVPQLEENIEQARWMSKSQWLELAPQSYPQIRQLFEAEFAHDL